MRFLVVLLAVILFSNLASSQGRYGKDSVECVKYLNYLKHSYEVEKNMSDALDFWRSSLKFCPPTASQNLFIYGQGIIKYLINQSGSNIDRKKELLDSLELMYEIRKRTYPKSAISAQTNKVYDLFTYSDNDKKTFEEVGKVIEMAKERTDPGILVLGLKKAVTLYQKGEFSPDVVMNFYTQAATIIKYQLGLDDPIKKGEAAGANKDFENIFVNSGVASCENIVKIYSPVFEEKKGDKEFINRVVYLLDKGGCTSENLFLQAVESLNKLEPSAKTAYYLYKLNFAKENHKEAVILLQQAIDSEETTDLEDGDYLLELATYYLKYLNSNIKAVENARLAMQKNPTLSGKAYMLIAAIWATNKCGGNEIESRAHFWVSYDYLLKAKNADPTLAEDADKLMAAYRQYFPATEEAFMYDVLDGNSYTVSCGGLRETTVVRTKK